MVLCIFVSMKYNDIINRMTESILSDLEFIQIREDQEEAIKAHLFIFLNIISEKTIREIFSDDL